MSKAYGAITDEQALDNPKMFYKPKQPSILIVSNFSAFSAFRKGSYGDTNAMDEEHIKHVILGEDLSKTGDEVSAPSLNSIKGGSDAEGGKQEEFKFENSYEKDSCKINGYKTKASEFKSYMELIIKEHEEYYGRCLIDMTHK